MDGVLALFELESICFWFSYVCSDKIYHMGQMETTLASAKLIFSGI